MVFKYIYGDMRFKGYLCDGDAQGYLLEKSIICRSLAVYHYCCYIHVTVCW